jgi:hypothetical protein
MTMGTRMTTGTRTVTTIATPIITGTATPRRRSSAQAPKSAAMTPALAAPAKNTKSAACECQCGVPAVAEPKKSLTGIWQGLYSYPLFREPVFFVATLIQSGVMLSGTIHESEVGRSGAPLKLFASISGSKHENAVLFAKTYNGSGGWDHAVHYDGILNGDATEIEGRWEIKDDWSGRFLMIRTPGTTERIARQVFEKI